MMSDNSKKTKLAIIVGLIIITVVLLIVCIYLVIRLSSDNKNLNDKTTTITSEVITTKNQTNINIPPNREKDVNKLNAMFMYSDISNIDYINDYNFKFMFLVYSFKDESANLKLDLNDIESNDSFCMTIADFNNYYFRYYGENFDINKLEKTSLFFNQIDFPVIKSDKIYTSFFTSLDPALLNFQYSTTTYDEVSGLYVDEIDIVKAKAGLDGYSYSSIGKIYLKYKVDPKGLISYKSFGRNN